MSLSIRTVHEIWFHYPKASELRLQVGVQEEGSFSRVRWHSVQARLVTKDITQKEGVDYNEIFSSLVKHTSFCVLLSLVSHHDLELEQLDVKTLFLHGDLDEGIYMHQPEGFKVVGKKNYVFVEKVVVWVEAVASTVVQAV